MVSLLRRLLRLRRLPRDLFSALNDMRAEIIQTRNSVGELRELLLEIYSSVQHIESANRARTAEVDRRYEHVTKFLLQERIDRTTIRRTLGQLQGDVAGLDDTMRQRRGLVGQGVLGVSTADPDCTID